MIFLLIFISYVSSYHFWKSFYHTHCSHEQIIGSWRFYLTKQDGGKDVVHNCKPDVFNISISEMVVYNLQYPNIVTNNETGNKGTWTMVYGAAIEMRIDGRRFLNFFQYEMLLFDSISICNETWTTWYHEDKAMNPQRWGCQYAVRITPPKNPERGNINVIPSKEYNIPNNSVFVGGEMKGLPVREIEISDFNEHYEFFSQFRDKTRLNDDLPKSFDWRNFNNTNFVDRVYDQGQCGSCYAFSVKQMLDCRARIMSSMKYQQNYSVEEIVDCGSPTLDGCGGGVPFLAAKWFGENGLEAESCYPYTTTTTNDDCKMDKCKVVDYVDEYYYIGGYRGAATEELMMEEIVKKGPIAVLILFQYELYHYKSGVFKCEPVVDPTWVVNHAVLIVGYGEDNKGEKYWIVKNTWGEKYGLNGYFWLRKGQNDCNVEAFPIGANLYFGKK